MNEPQYTSIIRFIFGQSNFRTILIFGRLIFGQKTSVRKLNLSENKYFMELKKVPVLYHKMLC